MSSSYVDTIAVFYPTRQVYSTGDGYDYDSLVASDGLPLPSKADLDQKKQALARDVVWRQIQAERDRRKYNGVKVGGNWFHTDDPSRIQQIGLVMMGQSLPPIQWKTLGGNFVIMTPTLAMQIFQATAQQDVTLFAIAEQHRAQMNQLQFPNLYDFSTGWPETYSPSNTPPV